jgi:hypothetical protein
MTEQAPLLIGSADQYLQHTRYVYAEFCVRAHEGGDFALLIETELGRHGFWLACIETGAVDESTVCPNEQWERKRKLLVRLKSPWEERKAQWLVTLALELGLEVTELESFAFRKGPPGGFVAACLRKIEVGAARDGFTLVGEREHFTGAMAFNRVDSVYK